MLLNFDQMTQPFSSSMSVNTTGADNGRIPWPLHSSIVTPFLVSKVLTHQEADVCYSESYLDGRC